MLRRNKEAHVIFFFLVVTIGILIFLQLVLQRKTGQKQTPDNGKDAQNFILTAMDDCYKKEGTNGCYKRLAQDIFARFPVDWIFRIFEENESRPEMFTNCHEVMHYIGREEYKREGNVGTALATCSHVCFEGCLHGVTEGYVIEKNLSLNDADKIAQEIPKICGKRDDYEKTQLFDQCVHGIGHAAMLITENDVPGALKLCDILEDSRQNEQCYSGVFMENSNSSTNKDHPSQFVRADDPLYPCVIMATRYKKMCYELQSLTFSAFTKGDWHKAFALCGNIPTEYQPHCFTMQGSALVGYTQDLQVIKSTCDLITNKTFKNACVRGVVITLATRYGGQANRMLSFCAIVAAENKKICFGQMGLSLREWTKSRENIERICFQIKEANERSACVSPMLFTQ